MYGSLPPAFIAGRDGRPWHSWRVLLLPFLEQTELYNAYRFDEPWDGPNNAKLAGRVGSIFKRPEAEGDRSSMTSFVAVVGPGTAYPGARAVKLGEIGDDRHRTIGFVEIADSDIPWMAPRDLRLDRMSYRINDHRGKGLGSPYGGARVVMLDGSIANLLDDLAPGVLKAMLTTNGGEMVEDDDTFRPIVRPSPDRSSAR